MKRLLATFALLLLGSAAQAATCSVSEFAALVTTTGGQTIPIAKSVSPGPTTQTVTATAPAAVTNPFGSGTRWLWIYCDELMHMQTGTDPATGLTTGDFRIPSGGFWYGVDEREARLGTLKIAFCDADCA